jgi:hypothetical protein
MLVRAVALFVLATSASAGQFSTGGSSQPMTMPFSNVVISVPQFDPNLGQLRSVYIRAEVDVQGTIDVENVSDQTIDSSIYPGCGGFFFAYASMSTSYCGNFLGPWQQEQCIPALAPFDGTIDYAGPSGAVVQFGPHWGYGMDNDFAGLHTGTGDSHPFILEAFTGTGVTPISTSANGILLEQWDPSVVPSVWSMIGTVDVSVTYSYDAYPATLCFPPDSQWCPCQNVGSTPFAGCANSHTDGAILAGTGVSRVLADSFALDATNLPPTTSVLFFQGTTSALSGVALGDGVRCVGGQLTRIGLKHASAGSAQYPGSSDTPISVKGGVPVGALRYYQAWYRDADPTFCTSATSNLTSAVATVWTP